MGLVHDAHHDVAVVLVLGGQLAPEACKLRVRGPALTDDLPVPSSVVVDIDDAVSTGGQASLHQRIIFAKVGRIKRSSEVAIDEELPPNRQPVSVQPIVPGKVAHLTGSINVVVAVLEQWWIGAAGRASALLELLDRCEASEKERKYISSATKIETSNVDSGELNSGKGPAQAQSNG